MQENIYAAPEAPLTNTEADTVEPAFYIVSPAKFITLFIFTFSLYGLYWHYKNWKTYKIFYSDKEPIPIMRAIFSIFFTHALFSVIDQRIKDTQREFTWKPTLLATIAVIVLLASRIIDRVIASEELNNPIDFLPIPLMAIYGFILFKAQRAINVGCNDPSGRSNHNFTVWNCLWIFVGSTFLCLVLLGIFLPE